MPENPRKGDAFSESPSLPTRSKVERVLIEADSFLQQGRTDKAIEHLAAAVNQDPTLHVLRRPLLRLYVIQGQHKSAIAQLWALLSSSEDTQKQVRYLRYILRLDNTCLAARQRLDALVSQAHLAAFSSSDERTVRDLDVLSPESIPTPPEASSTEVSDEGSSPSSGFLTQELADIEARLPQIRYPEALRRLQDLRTRYPQSKRVQAKLQSLEQAISRSTREIAPAAASHGDQHSYRHSHFQSSRPARPSGAATSRVAAQSTSMMTSGDAPGAAAQRRTVKLETESTHEVHPVPTEPSPSQAARPLSQAAEEKRNVAHAEAKHAFRTGITMRSFGQHKQAIAMFKQALGDPSYGARAALLTGLSFRELDRCAEAIAAFMTGVNMHEATDQELTALFYELGRSYEHLANAGEAIFYYQLVLGADGPTYDAAGRIARLQDAALKR